MTQLRRDAAYIRTKTRKDSGDSAAFSDFDEKVCAALKTAHTVTSLARTLSQPNPSRAATQANSPATGDQAANLESQVAASMLRLLEAGRIELSPDS